MCGCASIDFKRAYEFGENRMPLVRYMRALQETYVLHHARERRLNAESGIATIQITEANLRVNRNTKDLELCVKGSIEEKGEKREEEYSISFPLWNYSHALSHYVDRETYEQVMTEEREALFQHYLKTWTMLSDNPSEDIRRRQSYSENIKVKDQSTLQSLIHHQAEVHAKMRTQQVEKELRTKRQTEDITYIVRAVEGRAPLEV